jgi:hypothetical protein
MEAVMQQNRTLMEMFAQQNELNKQNTEQEKHQREAQEAHNAKTNDKFAQMMTAFIQQGISNCSATSPSPCLKSLTVERQNGCPVKSINKIVQCGFCLASILQKNIRISFPVHKPRN